jgi:hypothetical protein
VLAALLAGMIALAANMVLLSIASASGIRSAHGGLFLLFTKIIHRVAPSLSFMDGWKILTLPVSQAVFHIVTGLVMETNHGETSRLLLTLRGTPHRSKCGDIDQLMFDIGKEKVKERIRAAEGDQFWEITRAR